MSPKAGAGDSRCGQANAMGKSSDTVGTCTFRHPFWTSEPNAPFQADLYFSNKHRACGSSSSGNSLKKDEKDVCLAWPRSNWPLHFSRNHLKKGRISAIKNTSARLLDKTGTSRPRSASCTVLQNSLRMAGLVGSFCRCASSMPKRGKGLSTQDFFQLKLQKPRICGISLSAGTHSANSISSVSRKNWFHNLTFKPGLEDDAFILGPKPHCAGRRFRCAFDKSMKSSVNKKHHVLYWAIKNRAQRQDICSDTGIEIPEDTLSVCDHPDRGHVSKVLPKECSFVGICDRSQKKASMHE
eukprot:scaffold878_cov271-Pinguiococcus_pyrenoidosus.AAC.9